MFKGREPILRRGSLFSFPGDLQAACLLIDCMWWGFLFLGLFFFFFFWVFFVAAGITPRSKGAEMSKINKE